MQFEHLPLKEPPLLDEERRGRLLPRVARATRPTTTTGAARRSTAATSACRCRRSTSAAGTTSSSAARSRTSRACGRAAARGARAGRGCSSARGRTAAPTAPYPDQSFAQFDGRRRDRPRRPSSSRFFAAHLRGGAADEAPAGADLRDGRRTAGATRTTGRSRARGRDAWYLRADGGLLAGGAGRRGAGRVRLRPGRPGADARRARPRCRAGCCSTNAGPLDQRELEERDDVLVYTSEPLDAPARGHRPADRGPVRRDRRAADTDFVVKLCDVDARRASRGSWPRACCARASATASSSRAPDRARRGARVPRSTWWPRATCSCPGHRIRVDVTSSSFPRFDRNANTRPAAGRRRPRGPRRPPARRSSTTPRGRRTSCCRSCPS